MHVIKNVNLETVCGITSKLPDNTLPEVAFAGKSNVGKSSLINGLMNRNPMRGHLSSQGKPRRLIFIILTRIICRFARVMAMPKFLRRQGEMGNDD